MRSVGIAHAFSFAMFRAVRTEAGPCTNVGSEVQRDTGQPHCGLQLGTDREVKRKLSPLLIRANKANSTMLFRGRPSGSNCITPFLAGRELARELLSPGGFASLGVPVPKYSSHVAPTLQHFEDRGRQFPRCERLKNVTHSSQLQSCLGQVRIIVHR